MSIPFTEAQRAAIDISKRHRDTCVVAGPGSGKTTVLVEYFARLVDAGVDPLRILAITFTEKAASNMRAKVARKFESDAALRAQFERAWVYTIHGFCARLLREQAVWAGVDPEFAIADEHEALRLQQESLDAAMEELFAEDAEGVRALIRGLSSPDFEEHVRGAYDAMRSSGVGLQSLPEALAGDSMGRDLAALLNNLQAAPLTNWSLQQKQHLEEAIESAARILGAETAREALIELEAFPLKLPKCKSRTEAYELAKELRDELREYQYTLIAEHYAPQRAMLVEIIRRFGRIYRERKRRLAMLDFADLEEFTVTLLETHPEVRARLRSQFDHVLMDEFQDTNPQQAKLVRLVRPPDRFYAVGDINQSIYGFRHAEPEGFRQYRAEVEASGGNLVPLVDNFRSRTEILLAVETITAGCRGIEPRTLSAKRVFPGPAPEAAVELIGVDAEPAAAAARIEAQCVVRRIVEIASAECEYSDIAVLVRNTEALNDLAPALDEAGVPYLVNRGRGFYETREVNDLAHLLRVIANPRDEISLAAVLRSPLAAVSDEGLLRLRLLKESGGNLGGALYGISAEQAADFGADYARLVRFRERLSDWRSRRDYVSSDRLLLEAMDEAGYEPENGSRGAANIEKFLAQAREAAATTTLDEFIEQLEQIRKSNPREPDAPPEDSANAVKVMTVHAAKGLEFPVVFVAAMHKGVQEDPGVVAFSPRIGLGARWRNPAKREEKSDRNLHLIKKERKEREADESERLFYVAMTRAEKRLILSYAGKKPQEWAKLAVESLAINAEGCRDGVVERTAPNGKSWNLRVTMTDRAPELLRGARPADSKEAAVQVLDAPELSGQQDANATVTALARFAKCPREYYLAHYLGFEGRRRPVREDAEPEADLAADEFGSQVHALLAGEFVEAPSGEALRLVETFRSSELGQRAARATRIEREFEFLMALEDLVIRGSIDLWFEESGELAIVDYKTDAVSGPEAHQRARDYELQLKLYAQALERVTGRPADRAYLHFLRPDKIIEVDLRPSLLESPEQVARDLAEAQSRVDFPMHVAAHCRRCQFRGGLCPAELRVG